jgi:hypothetical protein
MSYALPVGASVRYFMQLMGQEIPDEYTMPDAETWEMRLRLIDEELTEMKEAYEEGDFAGFLDAAVDLVYVTAGVPLCAGLTQFDEAFAAVHAANMAKAPVCEDCKGSGELLARRLPAHEKQERGRFGKDETTTCGSCAGVGRIVSRRDDGKVLKPVGWTAPDIEAIIRKVTDASPSHPVR